jgi:steroid Delta-isomerase
MHESASQRLANYFNTLSPESVKSIGDFYTGDAYFRDPFNEIRGAAELERIFAEMFERLIEPRFTITEIIASEQGAFLVWNFDFRIKSLKPNVVRRIHGTSHVRFAADGRVNYHRDYWDAAGELYEHFPLVGSLMRWLKKRAG